LSRPSPDSQANVNKDTADDISVVRKILDLNSFYNIAVESVSVIESEHIVELRLRGMGLRSISSDIGHLKELRVLDIGKNSLKELPSSISNLTKLKTLVADSNELWVIPASLGILDSLESLDISANILQSLPEPLTYLEPVVLLKLDGNMLCNLGGLTVVWADKYDPGWKDLQVCQKHEIVLK
jgi:Leucine-rich repeat (LRR) protein